MTFSIRPLVKVFLSAGIAIMMLGLAFSSAAFASSGPANSRTIGHHTTFKPAINSSCSSPIFKIPNGDILNIAYVNKSYSVYVRQGPSTSTCAVTTQGPTMNVILAGPDQSGWYPVLYYFNQGCRSCSHYDWSHTGYIADFLLNTATVGYTCYQSSCPDFNTYSPAIPNSNDCRYFSNGNCTYYSNKPKPYTLSMKPPLALTLAPNWWLSSNSCPPDGQCAYVWNDDWWAN